MHPLISLVSFLLFAAFVSIGDIKNLLAGLLVLMAIWAASQTLPSARAWRMVQKLKLFFISILVLYVWFTPGKLLIPSLDNWSPTVEGLIFGGERIFALVMLVIAVDTLLSLLTKEKILSGLYYLFYPLHLLGFNRESFMIKTYLTLDAVTHKTSTPDVKNEFQFKNISAYIDTLANHIKTLITQTSIKKAQDEIIIEIDGPPIWYHWLIPLMLFIYFIGVYTW